MVFPSMGVAVTPVVNFGTEEQLVLTPEVLAGILVGNITSWNDPSILELNAIMYVCVVAFVRSFVRPFVCSCGDFVAARGRAVDLCAQHQTLTKRAVQASHHVRACLLLALLQGTTH